MHKCINIFIIRVSSDHIFLCLLIIIAYKMYLSFHNPLNKSIETYIFNTIKSQRSLNAYGTLGLHEPPPYRQSIDLFSHCLFSQRYILVFIFRLLKISARPRAQSLAVTWEFNLLNIIFSIFFFWFCSLRQPTGGAGKFKQ